MQHVFSQNALWKRWLSMSLVIILVLSMGLMTSSYAIEGTPDDLDGDGILNNYERDGYYFENGRIEKWYGNSSIPYFKTDMNHYSTDGDPYNDYEEVSGVSLDRTIAKPGNHPLVPAEPDIRVKLHSYDVTAKKVITDSEGNSTGETWTNEMTEVDMQAHTGSVEVSLSSTWSFGTETGTEVSVGVTTGYSGTHEWGTEKSVGATGESEFQWENAVEVDTSDAADLAFKLSYENIGTATAYNIQPTFNIKIGNTLVATVKPSQVIGSLKPGENTSPFIVDSAQSSEMQSANISVGLAELKALQLGMPVTIEVIGVSANVAKYDKDTGEISTDERWDYYKNTIDSISATIVLESDIPLESNGQKRKVAKIFAGTVNYNPQMTVREALVTCFDAYQDEVGDVYINDMKVTSDWRYYISRDASALNGVTNILDFVLKPEDKVLIRCFGTESNVKKPEILWADYSEDLRYVKAVIKEGDFDIREVLATVSVNNSIQTVKLELSQNGLYYINIIPFAVPADTSYQAIAKVFDSDENVKNQDSNGQEVVGNFFTKEVKVPKKPNWYYYPLPVYEELPSEDLSSGVGGARTYNLSYESLGSIEELSKADALVCQVTTENVSSPDFKVTLNNNTTVNMGTGDAGSGYWKIKLLDYNAETYTIEGYGDTTFPDITSVTTKEGESISHDIIDEIQVISGDPIYIELYEHSDYEGNQVGITGNKKLADYSFYNQLSSFKVYPLGKLVSEPAKLRFKDWGAYEKDKEFTGSWNVPSLWNAGLGCDNLDEIDKISERYDVFMRLYEHDNYGGKHRAFINDTGFLGDSGDFENTASSAKFEVYDRTKIGAKYSPSNSKMVVVPMDNEENLSIKWESNHYNSYAGGLLAEPKMQVNIIGYYSKAKGDSKTKFIPYSKDQRPKRKVSEVTGDLWSDITLNGNSNASAYMLRIKSKGVSSSDISFDINGAAWHLGNSETKDGGKQIATQYIPSYEQTFIVPVNHSAKSIISIAPTKSTFTGSDWRSEFEYEVIGYYADDNDQGYYFEPLSKRIWKKAGTSVDSIAIDTGNRVPKGYLIKIDNNDLSGWYQSMYVNAQPVSIGNGSSLGGNGVTAMNPELAPHNSTIAYVDVNPYNPTALGLWLSTTRSTYEHWGSSSSGAYVEVLGFFY